MATTVGVVSILEGPARAEAKRLWKLFETEYGSRSVQAFDHPHLTFHAGACLDLTELDDALSEACRQIRPFDMEIDGLGYFDSESPVIYMTVVPNRELLALHRQIGEAMGSHCVGMFERYLPGVWVPHISLGMGDLTPANFKRAWRDLQGLRPQFHIAFSNAHLVRRDSETGLVEIVSSYSCAATSAGEIPAPA
jgi:2'-5' RNA ligase